MSRRQLALALQGGGSHGAYTWGVLDRLLEEPGVDIEAISGASAGAVNAVLLAHGYREGGAAGARRSLERFWNAISNTPYSAAVTPAPQRADAASRSFLLLARFFSPYQLNPLKLNPLRDILAEQIDFEKLRACPMELFISATRVSDGGLKIFGRADITLDAVLASACIPSIHHTVEVDGVPYWDGGLAANPPLSVLVYKCRARDIVVVVLNPAPSDDVPEAADAIAERLTRIGFSATLSTELHSIALAKAEAERAPFALGRVDRRLRTLRLHMLASAAYMAELDPASRLNTDAEFIARLRDEGRKRAEAWLQASPASSDTRALEPVPELRLMTR